MATLAVALARGLRAAQPLATDVPNGNLYFVTDEGVTEQSDGSAWVSYSGSGGAGTVTHTGALTASRVVVGNGTDDLKVLGSLGTTTTVLHGNAAGLPSFSAVALATDVSGVLPVVNGGTGSTAGSGLLVAAGTITNANIKKLTNTTVTLIAAPAAGYWNHVLSATLVTRFTAGAYTGLDPVYSALQIYPATTDTWLVTPIVNDNTLTTPLARLSTVFGAVNRLVYCPEYSEAVLQGTSSGDFGYTEPLCDFTPAQFEALATVIGIDNNGSVTDLGGGNAANTLHWTIYYAVETTS